MRRFLVKIQYDGRRYSGWQKQKNAQTVQGEIDEALSKLFGEEIRSVGCSRTDAGVSAEEYYFHFDADTKLPEGRVCFKLNRFLPPDIQAQESKEVAPTFDARRDVTGKTYVYSFYVSAHRMPLLSRDRVQIERSVNVEEMRRQAQCLVGTHDFASFRTVGYEEGSQTKSTVRTLRAVEIRQDGVKLDLYFTGDGFLYNMVRILSGSLLAVGIGEIGDLKAVLEARNRSLAGETLPPKGLRLHRVYYRES